MKNHNFVHIQTSNFFVINGIFFLVNISFWILMKFCFFLNWETWTKRDNWIYHFSVVCANKAVHTLQSLTLIHCLHILGFCNSFQVSTTHYNISHDWQLQILSSVLGHRLVKIDMFKKFSLHSTNTWHFYVGIWPIHWYIEVTCY
jgi:hypothetical protein